MSPISAVQISNSPQTLRSTGPESGLGLLIAANSNAGRHRVLNSQTQTRRAKTLNSQVSHRETITSDAYINALNQYARTTRCLIA
jgi:hypothetical protein